MGDTLDPELVARSINFHGQPLQKLWESERDEGDLQKLNIDLDSSVYLQRQKNLNFQDRGKRLKLHQFIVKKANVLFDAEFNEREERPPVKTNEPGLYAILPPYESFLNVDKSSRIKHFFQCVEYGDIVYASIISKMASGLVLKILCLDGESPRYVADLNIKAHCHTMNLIAAIDKKNLTRQFLINDLVCCEVLEVVADTEKLTCGMKGVTATGQRALARLGLVHSDDFPESYKQAQEYSKGELYNDLLENSVGFNNPSNINCLSNALGLGMNNFTNMTGMRCRFPEGEYASELRQEQASKWAFRSVAEGIDHFKAGRHTEAFQCLNKALNIDPRNIEGLVARGALYANSGNFKKAIDDFECALKINSTHQNARRYLGETLVAFGRSYEDQNQMDEALKAYEKCLTIVPFHEEAQNSIEYIKTKQANGSVKTIEGEIAIPGLTPGKAQGVKDTLKQLIGESGAKDESSKKKKKEKKRKHHRRSSSTSSSSTSASSSSSSSSSSSDSSSGSSQDSHHKKKHKRKSEHKDRSLSPLSKRMAMMEDSTAENEGFPASGSQRGGSHYNPPSLPFSFTGEPQSNQDAYVDDPTKEKESEYEQRVRKFLEQTKGDLDYEEKVRKFLDETAKWKKERKALEEKAKKKKKKEKKARSKSKKKKREEKRKKKALKELQEKKIREVLRRDKQRRRSSSHLEEEEEFIFGDKPDLRLLNMGSLNELEELQGKLTAFYAKVEKSAPLPKKKENSSDKSLGSISGIGKSKPSPKQMYEDEEDEEDPKHEESPPPINRGGPWDTSAEKKRMDIFADSPTRHAEPKLSISSITDAQNNLPSKFKMQIGNVGNRLKRKDKAEDGKEPWDEVEDSRFIYVKKEGNESSDDVLPKKTPDKKKDLEELSKRPTILDKLGGFRIDPSAAIAEKKKEMSPDVKPQKRKIRTRTSESESSDSEQEPRRNLKKEQERSPESSRSRSRSHSRKKYSSESPKKYSSRSRSSSYRKERSRSKSGSYRSRSRRYRSSESGSYRSRSYSRSRSRSRSGDYYRRSRSRSDDRHHYRNKYQGRYPRNRGTYYRPRFQNYKSPRGGSSYGQRGHRGRGGYSGNRNRGYAPRIRGRGRPRYFHYKPSDRRDYRRYDRGISRSDDDDMSPMRKVDAAKERIDKMIAEEKRHTGPLSEGEERDDEYIDRKEYDGKWATKDSEGQHMSPSNDDDVDKFLNKVKSQKK